MRQSYADERATLSGRSPAPDGAPQGARELVLAVATYERPDDIARCLTALRQERERFLAEGHDWAVRIVVVDNSPAGTAREAVQRHAGPEVTYVVEPRPGISAARNKALELAGDADGLVYIDDDEVPVAGWLGHLVRTYETTGAAAVAGRVVSAFEVEPEPWLLAGGFFRRRSLPTGTGIDVAATNNLLLDLEVVRSHGLRFADEYGLVGGGDTHFTRRLRRLGLPMVWCDEAVVIDHVPATRISREWVIARARRTGNTEVVVALALATGAAERLQVRARALTRGLARVAGGTVKGLAGRLTGSTRLAAQGAKARSRGLGMLLGVARRSVAEYQRPVPTGADTVRVLASFPEPRPTTNPYIVQLADALRRTPTVALETFTWRRALLGRYDVVHLHWPENLVTGRTATRTAVRVVLLAALLARWTARRTPVVRTVHNTSPHERRAWPQRLLLALVERRVVHRIALNPGHPRTADSVVLHGDYVASFSDVDVPASVAGRITFAGLIRPYKNVVGLLHAFRGATDPGLSLHVAGRPADEALAEEVRAAASADDRVSVRLEFLPDEDLAREVGEAELVVLPYAEMLNSGAALLALSLRRPILVPRNDVNDLLAAEVGEAWVQRFDGPLEAADLLRALAAVRAAGLASAAPDLTRRSWDGVGESHAAVYAEVLAQVRGR